MKVYTYYENIYFKHQDRLINSWKESWQRRGFLPVVLKRENAEANPLCKYFLESIQDLSKRISGKEIDIYGLACWLRWLAYSSQPEEKFYVCDYDVINHSFPVTEPSEELCLLDGDCPCIASGKPSQFQDLCEKFLKIPSGNLEEFIGYYKKLGFVHYHDQEFFQVCEKLNIGGILMKREREVFFSAPSEKDFWKRQIVHYGHDTCHAYCDQRGIEFDEESRCRIIEEYSKYENR